MTSKNKNRLFTLILCLLTPTACFLAGEVFTHFYYFLSPRFGRPYFVPDPYLGYVYPRQAQFVYTYDEGGETTRRVTVPHRTNSQGMMGKEITAKKPPQTFRILVLGDSFTEALQVGDDENFCARLERLYNSDGKRPLPRFEVANAGISGYSPISMYLYFKRKLTRLKPDLVVVQLFANDVYEDTKSTAMSDLGPDGLPVKIRPFFEPNPTPGMIFEDQSRFNQIREWVISHSRCVEFLYGKYYREKKKSSYNKKMTDGPPYFIGHQFFILFKPAGFFDEKFFHKAYGLTEKYLLALKQEVESSGARLLVIYIPMEGQLAKKEYSQHVKAYMNAPIVNDVNQWLESFTRAQNVPFLDFLPIFEKHKEEAIYLNHDGHLTPHGHALVAEALEKVLRAQNLTPHR